MEQYPATDLKGMGLFVRMSLSEASTASGFLFERVIGYKGGRRCPLVFQKPAWLYRRSQAKLPPLVGLSRSLCRVVVVGATKQ